MVVEKSTLHNQVSNEQLARFMAQQSSAPGSLIWDKRKTTKISQKKKSENQKNSFETLNFF